MDAVDVPIPHGSSKRKAVREALPRLKADLKRLCAKPEIKIILVSKSVYSVCDDLKKDGFNVINNEMIDFPAFGRQGRFRRKLKSLLLGHDGLAPNSSLKESSNADSSRAEARSE